jgi:hypothetical protein
MPVKKADLEPLTFLASGGFGAVYRVDGAFRLDDDPVPLAYKEFTKDQVRQAEAAQAVLAFRAGLKPEDRADLDRYGTWPRMLVTQKSRVSGFVMPLIPTEFYYHVRAADGSMTPKVRDLEWLITTEAYRKSAGVDIGSIDHALRLTLLAQLVYAVGRLHRHNMVFGDVSFRNAAFALDPPRLMLLDCDGAAQLTDLDRKQFSTALWEPPESVDPKPGWMLDRESDVYKLALAVLRCLNPGRGAASFKLPSKLTGKLEPTAVASFTAALSGEPHLRPTVRELYEHLHQAVLSRIKVPRMPAGRLAQPYILAGADARIEWQIEDATDVTVVAGRGQRFSVDLAANPRHFTFRPDESGPVSVELRNDLATATADLGELTLYELPSLTIHLGDLPWPTVPAVPGFSLGPMTAIRDCRPDAGLKIPALPPVPSPPSFDLVTSLMPEGLLAPPTGLHETAAETAAAIKGLILDEGSKLADAIRQAKLGGG